MNTEWIQNIWTQTDNLSIFAGVALEGEFEVDELSGGGEVQHGRDGHLGVATLGGQAGRQVPEAACHEGGVVDGEAALTVPLLDIRVKMLYSTGRRECKLRYPQVIHISATRCSHK